MAARDKGRARNSFGEVVSSQVVDDWGAQFEAMSRCGGCGFRRDEHHSTSLRCPSGFTGKKRTYSNRYSFGQTRRTTR